MKMKSALDQKLLFFAGDINRSREFVSSEYGTRRKLIDGIVKKNKYQNDERSPEEIFDIWVLSLGATDSV